MHLRLIKGLSYDGVVRASAAHPDVFVDDPEKYTALLESGYFEALPDAHTVTGHLSADFLGEMDEEQLNKLADEMGVDVAEISDETTFDDLDANSLERLQLVTAIEDEFNLEIDDETLLSLNSVADAVDAIENAREA